MFTPTAVQKQVYSLSWLVDSTAINAWTLTQLQAALDQISGNIGKWTVVWGPCLYYPTGSNDVANAMFVAQSTDANNNPVYVVAIAGTNMSSSFDWMTEDFDISPLDWPYVSNPPQQMQVTTGDNDGLTILLGMTSSSMTLQDFLYSIANKSTTTLWFTGHSLGGALAPMATLALMDPTSTLNSSNDISLSNWGDVLLLAAAGPAIGDANFVSYFASTFYNQPQSSINQDSFIWSGSDVVPHAWNAATIQALTTPQNIYGLDFNSSSCMATSIAKMQTAAAQYTYQQFQPTAAFAGALQPYTDPLLFGAESSFLAQMVYQHVNAYLEAFNITWFQAPINLCQHPAEAAAALASFDSQVCG